MINKLNILFPIPFLGGNEKAFIKILNCLSEHAKFSVYSNKLIEINLLDSLDSKSFYHLTFINNFQLYRILFKGRNETWIIVSGSPLGHISIKVFCLIFRIRLIEYTAFSDYDLKFDRLHHHIMPIINKLALHARILIDEWQIDNSVVKRNYIIKNIV
jgi:hypothetical protein